MKKLLSEFIINSQILYYWYCSCSFMGKCDIHIDFDKNEYPNIFVGIKAVQNSQKKNT